MDSKKFIASLSRRTGMDTATTCRLVEALAEALGAHCTTCSGVAIPAFGTFRGVKHDEEVRADLATGRKVLMPPVIEIEFTPGSRLRRAANTPRQ